MNSTMYQKVLYGCSMENECFYKDVCSYLRANERDFWLFFLVDARESLFPQLPCERECPYREEPYCEKKENEDN